MDRCYEHILKSCVGSIIGHHREDFVNMRKTLGGVTGKTSENECIYAPNPAVLHSNQPPARGQWEGSFRHYRYRLSIELNVLKFRVFKF